MYSQELDVAIDRSRKIGMLSDRWTDLPAKIDKDELSKVNLILRRVIAPGLVESFGPYLGDRCADTSANIFAFLRSIGISCDVVIGDVKIHGQSEYNTEFNYVVNEYKKTNQDGNLKLHIWVSMGGDSVIDFSIMDRLRRKGHEIGDRLVVASNRDLGEVGLEYIPMLVGADYLMKTNDFGVSLNELIEEQTSFNPVTIGKPLFYN